MLRTDVEHHKGESVKVWLRRHLTVAKETEELSQKMAVYLYILSGPFHFLAKKIGIKKSHKYILPITLKTEFGFIACGKHVSDAAIASSWHEPEIELALKKIVGGTFIDVGSHIGRFSLQVAHQVKNKGKVIAIEAQPAIFQRLFHNINLNKLDNTVAYFSAAANYDGLIKFYTDTVGVAGGHSIAGKLINENARELLVPAITIDSLIKNLKIRDVNCIKLDVECAEGQVLEGAMNTIKKFKPMILFEAMDQEEYNKVMKYLRKFKYKTTKLSSINYVAEAK